MKKTKIIRFAAGCFWCIEEKLSQEKGVLSTTVGYTGGSTENPTYEDVCGGKTNHYEAIEVLYDPDIITLKKLVNIYLMQVDPENGEGQFCDIGTQYHLAIFYNDKNEKEEIEEILRIHIEKFHLKQMNIQLLEAKKFFVAEDYHQKFYLKNPSHYFQYKKFSGRDNRLKKLYKAE